MYPMINLHETQKSSLDVKMIQVMKLDTYRKALAYTQK